MRVSIVFVALMTVGCVGPVSSSAPARQDGGLNLSDAEWRIALAVGDQDSRTEHCRTGTSSQWYSTAGESCRIASYSVRRRQPRIGAKIELRGCREYDERSTCEAFVRGAGDPALGSNLNDAAEDIGARMCPGNQSICGYWAALIRKRYPNDRERLRQALIVGCKVSVNACTDLEIDFGQDVDLEKARARSDAQADRERQQRREERSEREADAQQRRQDDEDDRRSRAAAIQNATDAVLGRSAPQSSANPQASQDARSSEACMVSASCAAKWKGFACTCCTPCKGGGCVKPPDPPSTGAAPACMPEK